MKELLTTIERLLGEKMKSVNGVFVTTDEQVIPDGVKLPCLTIKDGAVSVTDLPGGVREKTMGVTFIAWSPQGKDAAQVIGDKTQTGVLGILDEIVTLLQNNRLGIPGMIDGRQQSEAASVLYIGQNNKTVQQKTMTFQYVRQQGDEL